MTCREYAKDDSCGERCGRSEAGALAGPTRPTNGHAEAGPVYNVVPFAIEM
jgi:hypothetical protein